jgi:hypothetical protein
VTDFVFEFDLGMVQESKRRVRRRAARLTLGTTTKRLLSDEEALALFQAIDSKQYSSFGLVKLSTLNLNELYRPPLRKLEKPSLRTWNPSGSCSLLTYAAYRMRDVVVMNLLNAGSDPSIYYDETLKKSSCVPGVLNYIKGVQGYSPEYAAWIVRRVVAGRVQAAEVLESATQQQQQGFNCICEYCRSASVRPVCICSRCKHLVCEQCFWKAQQERPLKTRIAELSCRACGGKGDTEGKAEAGNGTLDKFLLLPVELKPAEYKRATRCKFKAMRENEAAALRPGVTRRERAEQFLKAVSQGNMLRVRALIRAGVDPNVRGEVGETALNIAEWMGYVGIRDMLLGIDNIDPALIPYGAKALGSKGLGVEDSGTEPKFSHILRQHFSSEATVVVDKGFSESFLGCLGDIYSSLHPVDLTPTKRRTFSQTCAVRSVFCDWKGEICKAIENVLNQGFSTVRCTVHPMMRFICYVQKGGSMPIHTDLAKTDARSGNTSTHTFILHLNDCDDGGETAFYKQVKCDEKALAKVYPVRGRLLVFPHDRAHAGLAVFKENQKLFLRGEVMVSVTK